MHGTTAEMMNSKLRFPSCLCPLPGLDGSYHPESSGTLMGAAMSVAKNVASNPAISIAGGGAGAVPDETTPAGSAAETFSASEDAVTANGAAKVTSGDLPETNGGRSNGGAEGAPLEVVAPPELAKTTSKSEAPAPSGRKSSFLLNMGGKQSPERGAADRRPPGTGGPSSRVSSPANAPGGGGSGPIGGERNRKKSSESRVRVNSFERESWLVLLPLCSMCCCGAALRCRPVGLALERFLRFRSTLFRLVL